jgi:membrane dipeptidase
MKTDSRSVHEDAIVIDALNVSNFDSERVFECLRAGGITTISATLATWENFHQGMAQVTAWLRRFRERTDIYRVLNVADIHRAKELGKTGIILSFQNASPIENDLDRLALFQTLGVLIIQFTYHERNLLGNGCMERNDDGVSNFGVDAIKEMNDLGILIDLSHCGDRTTMEVIDHSEKPVAITHANARSFYDHRRNKTDEAIKLLAERGGVIGACAFTSFLPKKSESTVDDFVDSIDDLVQRVGIDQVGVGTDATQDQELPFWHFIAGQQGTKFPSSFSDPSMRYTEDSFQPKGMETPAEWPNLTNTLLRRGYSVEDTKKLLGGNWLRLFEEVWPD